MFEKYKEYYKNNPEGFWFKRKLYGWGWTPVKWQGWLVILAFVAFLVWNGLSLGSEPTDTTLTWFFVKIAVAVILLILICYKKGEKPRWQWGIPKDEDLK
ncbi:MAG: hypothetical protein AAB446_02900 [Patescibacteria group bacterium]|mgnify:FL=1